MKSLKTAIAALLIAGGTFTAFAFSANSNNENKVATTYFAIEDAPNSNSYHWSTSVPEGYECVEGKAVCSITTSTPPTNNQLPSGVPSTNKVYRLIP